MQDPVDADVDEAITREVVRFLHLPGPLEAGDPDALPCLRDGWRKCKQDLRDFEQDYWTARYTAEADPDATPAEREQARADAETAARWMAAAETEAGLIEAEAHRLKNAPARSTRSRPPVTPRRHMRRAARRRERRARRTRARSPGGSDPDPGEPEPPIGGPRSLRLLRAAVLAAGAVS